MENIIISNPKEFEEKRKNIIKNSFENLHILTDFDRTLTKAYLENGEFIPSIISILRDEDFLTEDYPQKARDLFNKYHPIEIDSKINLEEKKKLMEEWWKKHSKLLIESNLNKKDLEKAGKSKRLIFRKYYKEIFQILNEKKVPIVILSANGLGTQSCIEVLKHHKLLLKNIFVISNEYIWNKEGYAIDYINPHIHTFNKNETVIKKSKIYSKIENRKNIILLGDSIGDSNMDEGFGSKNIIKIGFLNMEINEKLEEYKKNYDIVITNDSSAEFILDLIKAICI